MGVVRPCMECVSHFWGGSTHTALLEKVQSRAFRLINYSALTNSLQSLSTRRTLYTIAITMNTALPNSPVVYLLQLPITCTALNAVYLVMSAF